MTILNSLISKNLQTTMRQMVSGDGNIFHACDFHDGKPPALCSFGMTQIGRFAVDAARSTLETGSDLNSQRLRNVYGCHILLNNLCGDTLQAAVGVPIYRSPRPYPRFEGGRVYVHLPDHALPRGVAWKKAAGIQAGPRRRNATDRAV